MELLDGEDFLDLSEVLEEVLELGLGVVPGDLGEDDRVVRGEEPHLRALDHLVDFPLLPVDDPAGEQQEAHEREDGNHLLVMLVDVPEGQDAHFDLELSRLCVKGEVLMLEA